MHACAAGTGQIFVKLDIGNFCEKFAEQIQNWLKLVNSIGHFTYRRRYVYIVDNSTKYFVAPQRCKGNPLLRLHGNTEHFCIVHIHMEVNSSAKGMYSNVSLATFVTRMFHSVILCVYCLSFLLCEPNLNNYYVPWGSDDVV